MIKTGAKINPILKRKHNGRHQGSPRSVLWRSLQNHHVLLSILIVKEENGDGGGRGGEKNATRNKEEELRRAPRQ